MRVRAQFIRSIAFGVLVGAIGMSAAMAAYLRVIEPDIAGLIVWLLIGLYGVPTGAWLGGAAGMGIVFQILKEPRLAGSTWFAAGFAVLAFFTYFAGWVDPDEVFRLFAIPILTSAAYCIVGLLLVFSPKRK